MASQAEAKKAASDALDALLFPTVMHSNREQQEQYAEAKLPGNSAGLIRAAQERGWAWRSGWSKTLVPAGYRQSVHHSRAKEAHYVMWFGVYVWTMGAKARAHWKDGAFEGAQLKANGRIDPIGLDALIAYMRGE